MIMGSGASYGFGSLAKPRRGFAEFGPRRLGESLLLKQVVGDQPTVPLPTQSAAAGAPDADRAHVLADATRAAFRMPAPRSVRAAGRGGPLQEMRRLTIQIFFGENGEVQKWYSLGWRLDDAKTALALVA